jgi:antitoxin VapB
LVIDSDETEQQADQGGLDFEATRYLHVDMHTAITRAKLFKHGGSQAARLPREFRLPGTEAAISRTSTGGVLLEPLNADFEARRRHFFALAGSCPDLLDVPAHITPDVPRDE